MHFTNQTLRQIVHTSIGGNRARVVLSNRFGTAPLTIAAAHVALRDKEATIVPQSDRVLTFSGRPTITMPAGAMVYSDPVELNVPPMGDLAIDLYLPGDTNTPSPLTMHNGAFQTNYVSQSGNHAGEAELPVMTTTLAWFFLSRVEVVAPPQTVPEEVTPAASWTIPAIRAALETKKISARELAQDYYARIEQRNRAPVREAAPLFADAASSTQIGAVTSGGFGPSINAPVAMGYLPSSHAAMGDTVFAELRGQRLPLRVAAMPFVPNTYKR